MSKKLSQNDSGRAFEYGIAVSLSRFLNAEIEDSKQVRKAKKCFEDSKEAEQIKIVKASDEIVLFIIAHDKRLTDKNCTIKLQSDQKGQTGDVRDIIVYNSKLKEEIGISAKNRHSAVKASRLSEQIDFGTDWMGIRCSDAYFHQVVPLFREMRSRGKKGELWVNMTDKKHRFYMPILQAFQSEMQLLFANNPTDTAKSLVQYLLGAPDYYKIIKQNGTVSVTSFNITGTLKWGSKMPLPTSITDISQKPKSLTTLFMTFNKGWQLGFRIHNADKIIEPSLKFDITIIGMPQSISRHEIKYLNG
jgi:hypothetical protein